MSDDHWQGSKIFRQKMHLLAAELRQRHTNSEALLWSKLRNRQLENKKFRRQVPIGRFVVDFYCAEFKLAIEIDGGIHDFQLAEDQDRQTLIEQLGITFLRFRVEQVEQDLEEVMSVIRSRLNA